MSVQTEAMKSSALADNAVSPPGRLRGGDVLACGFGITAAVWIAAYLCRLPFVHASGQATVAVMLTVIFAGGFAAARYSVRGWACSLWAGALSGLLDILIMGSLITDYAKSEHEAAVPSATLWIVGSIVLNTLLASAGGFVGKWFPSKRRSELVWNHMFAAVLALTTLLLICAGGFVTAFRAGLAVPDWPQSYGYNMFLFPLSLMQQESGRFYEHAHRLIASLVGFTALCLAIHTTLAEKRGWIKILAWAIGFGVLLQAIAGGLRVTDKNIALAIAHGVFAQVVFAAMIVLVAATSPLFTTLPRTTRPEGSTDRALTVTLVATIILQLILGAVLRHLNALLLLHITVATVVVLLALTCGIRAWGLNSQLRPLVKIGLAMLAVVALQIVLGLIALVVRTPGEQPSVTGALITTFHQANGALLLALSAALMAWTWRLIIPGQVQQLPPDALPA